MGGCQRSEPDLSRTSCKGWNEGKCYCIEGNTVDRDSNKNGKGYCEDVSPTLNTQDKHAVAYAVENYPQDSRVQFARDNVVQPLTAKCGMGGVTCQ